MEVINMKSFYVVNYTTNLIASIICLIIGVIIYTRPDLVVILLTYVLGSLLIFIGLCKIIKYAYLKGKDSSYPLNDIIDFVRENPGYLLKNIVLHGQAKLKRLKYHKNSLREL